MTLAVEAPAREDLSLRTNDDKLVGARWYKSDGVTPVTIDTATLTFRFDLPPVVYDPDSGEPLPFDVEYHVIDGTTPADPDGWIDAANLANGVVLVTVPHGIWASYSTSTGGWDLVAVGEGIQRCLVRGRFAVEEGVST